ncbi:MAG: ribose-phosphate pyrophosphokinase [Armatimonadota bacterium]
MLIFSGNSNEPLARNIALELGATPGEASVERFSDGEVRVQIEESVRGADTFVVQSTCPPVNENLMELLVMIDALKRGSAGRIVAVIPYYGYARQDRKSKGREPITAKLVANLITSAGADRVLTMDLHADQIMGFFDIPVDHLPARRIIASHFLDHDLQGDDVAVVSPDVGGLDEAKSMADELNATLAIIAKRRRRPNQVEAIEVIGDLKGKRAILLDDMVDTAGTVCLGARMLRERDAAAVYCAATHPVLSGPAIERLRDAPFEALVFTNTILVPDDKLFDRMTILTVAPLFADAIDRIHRDESVSKCLARQSARQQRMF